MGSPEVVFQETSAALVAAGLSAPSIQFIQNPDWKGVEKDLLWLQQPHHCLIPMTSGQYPELLKQIYDPPPVLFVSGDPDLLQLPQLAIVGSRNPSRNGQAIAEEFAQTLANHGLCITSGLALGIDACAHRGALQGTSGTLAVAGTGLDRVYPARHRQLAHQIAEQGVLISELTPDTQAHAQHFPRRNRIISGLSLGVLIVEAALQSGSLITARLALEQNRAVFAIPGAINNPLARGCNQLIKQGAILVETVQDILQEIAPLVTCSVEPHTEPENIRKIDLDQQHLDLLKSVAYAPTSVDTLVRETGCPVEVISSMLLVLELEGHVASAAGGCYYRLS